MGVEMLLTVDKEQVTVSGTKLITEASTVGIRPGEKLPDFVVVMDGSEGFLFGPGARAVFHDGEPKAWVYVNRSGSVELHILND